MPTIEELKLQIDREVTNLQENLMKLSNLSSQLDDAKNLVRTHIEETGKCLGDIKTKWEELLRLYSEHADKLKEEVDKLLEQNKALIEKGEKVVKHFEDIDNRVKGRFDKIDKEINLMHKNLTYLSIGIAIVSLLILTWLIWKSYNP